MLLSRSVTENDAPVDQRQSASWSTSAAPAERDSRIRAAMSIDNFMAAGLIIATDVAALLLVVGGVVVSRHFGSTSCAQHWRTVQRNAYVGIGLGAVVAVVFSIFALWRGWRPRLVIALQIVLVLGLLPGQLNTAHHARHELQLIAAGQPASTDTNLLAFASDCQVTAPPGG